MMKTLLRAAGLGALIASVVGCSGGHGFLGTDYLPKGDIALTDASTGSALTTSVQKPFVTSKSGFTIGIAETNFSGPYTVTITSWNNGFNIPCFATKNADTSSHINTVLFTAVNANPPTTPTTQANPCVANGQDLETAAITDGKGHTVNFYYVLQ